MKINDIILFGICLIVCFEVIRWNMKYKKKICFLLFNYSYLIICSDEGELVFLVRN